MDRPARRRPRRPPRAAGGRHRRGPHHREPVLTETIRIAPGGSGYAEALGADPNALALLSTLGVAPPRRAGHPAAFPTDHGPLTRLALVAEAARRLERSGHTVDLGPRLRLSSTAEQALEILADLADLIGELSDLLPAMGIHELAAVAGQMTTGTGSAMEATRAMFEAGARTARRTDAPEHEREEIARWFQAGAHAAARMAALAAATAYPASADPAAERARAARTRSPAARTAAVPPVSTAPATATNTPTRSRA
ncbi:hypothetical protein ACFVVU_30635 [Kitasatospora sp. NPDC057965]|uniref:hypothetical protein n=1 Tax=Kitasatospora sp. NPDC057965 TaxID=3346291 RepID=UPI0036DBCD8B